MFAGLADSPEEAGEKIKTVTKDDIIEAANKVVLDTIYFMRGTLTEGADSDEQ
jgi:predicted Zn-dependent peptidase